MKLLAPIAIIVSLTGCAAMQPVSEADKNIEVITEAQNLPKTKFLQALRFGLLKTLSQQKRLLSMKTKKKV